MNFLSMLRDDLHAGLMTHPEPDRLARHARWISAQQGPLGGFKNRRGREDLYYTTFALRGLSVLGALSSEIATKARSFLLNQAERTDTAFGNAVHAVSWWDAYALCAEACGDQLSEKNIDVFREETCTRLARLRRPDGGWAKTSTEQDGSLYHSFLAACTLQRMQSALPEDAGSQLETFLKGRRVPDGGYLESCYSKTPGVNGSAAGIALAFLVKGLNLKWGARTVTSLHGMPAILKRAFSKDLVEHAEFLKRMQNEEGGFQATVNAPFADLLSTYTALFSLELLGGRTREVTAKALAFAHEMEDPEGGYVGFALEHDADCEYTFYGLGVERMRAG